MQQQDNILHQQYTSVRNEYCYHWGRCRKGRAVFTPEVVNDYLTRLAVCIQPEQPETWFKIEARQLYLVIIHTYPNLVLPPYALNQDQLITAFKDLMHAPLFFKQSTAEQDIAKRILLSLEQSETSAEPFATLKI